MIITPLSRPPNAAIEIPGSKSITNRALLIAALASGTTVLRGALVADDTGAMIEAVGALGAAVDQQGSALSVAGVGGRLPIAPVELDARQAATVGRFLPAVLAASSGPHTVTGGAQLQKRPMAPLFAALRQVGVTVTATGADEHLPVEIAGPATGGAVRLPGDVSSQFLSALLLAAPLYPRGLNVELTTALVSRPYVRMTIAIMSTFGVTAVADERRYDVDSGLYIAPGDYHIEPDASSASYFFAAAAMTGGRVRIDGLSRSSLQGDLRFVDVLASMGAEVIYGDDFVEVSGRASTGIDVALTNCSDTLPTLAVVAAVADSPTTIRGVGFVRGKETDRIRAVVTELRRLGIRADEFDDGLVIHPAPVQSAAVETYGDHRMAMAFALLGLTTAGVDILDPGCVAKTFPEYFAVLDELRA